MEKYKESTKQRDVSLKKLTRFTNLQPINQKKEKTKTNKIKNEKRHYNRH